MPEFTRLGTDSNWNIRDAVSELELYNVDVDNRDSTAIRAE